MTLDTLIRLSRWYADLGGTIMSQAEAVILQCEALEDQNPNALHYISEWLREVCFQCNDKELAEEAADLMAALENEEAS